MPLGDYLADGPAQRRLLALMADGHARRKHGTELGNPSRDAYQSRVRRHLGDAPVGFAVTAPGGSRRYLVADPRTNQAAWVNPRKEHRSTFFQPWQGVDAYVRRAQESHPASRWRPVDLSRLRAAPTRVRSAVRTTSHGRDPGFAR